MKIPIFNITSPISKERRRWLLYFVFVSFLLPAIDVSGYSSILNLIIPNPLGYKFLSLVLSIPFLSKFKFNNTEIRLVAFAIIIATIYQLGVFLSTCSGVGFFNALTVYRHAYCQCLHLCILLPFIFKMNQYDILYVLKLMIRIIIIFSIIYIIDNLFVHFLSTIALGQVLAETRGGVSVERSIIGFPPIIGGWTFLLFCLAFEGNSRATKLFILCLFVTFISFTRSLLLETAIGCLLVSAIFSLKGSNYLNRWFKLVALLFFCFMIISVVLPESLAFWDNKLTETFSEEMKNGEGTYSFRERLIEDAQYAIRHNRVTGLGYIRDVHKGEYSMVLGGDTYIAPVLWCEGYLGLFLRIVPYFLLVIISLRRILLKNTMQSIDVTIIALVLSSLIGYVQTKSIVCYPLTLMILLLLKQLQYYYERTKNISSYCIV